MANFLASVSDWLGAVFGWIGTGISPFVGVVLGGVLVWMGDARKDKRALRRERDARRDEFLHQHLTEEREALLRISKELEPLLRLFEHSLRSEESEHKRMNQVIKVTAMAQRCSDVSVRKALSQMYMRPEIQAGEIPGDKIQNLVTEKVQDYFAALSAIRVCLQENDIVLLSGSEKAISHVLKKLEISTAEQNEDQRVVR